MLSFLSLLHPVIIILTELAPRSFRYPADFWMSHPSHSIHPKMVWKVEFGAPISNSSFNSVQTRFCGIDESMRIGGFITAVKSLLGYDKDELQGTPITSVMPNWRLNLAARTDSDAMASNGSIRNVSVTSTLAGDKTMLFSA